MKLLESTSVYDGFLKIFRNKYLTASGTELTREVMERGDSVAAIIYDITTGKLVFTKQPRPATFDKTIWPDDFLEVMAGVIEPGESAYEALERELVEEVGYTILRHEFIGRFFVSPGGTSERIFLYYVEVEGKISKGGGVGDEEISEYAIPVSHVKSYLDSGSIEDAKTIIGIQWFLINELDNLLIQ